MTFSFVSIMTTMADSCCSIHWNSRTICSLCHLQSRAWTSSTSLPGLSPLNCEQSSQPNASRELPRQLQEVLRVFYVFTRGHLSQVHGSSVGHDGPHRPSPFSDHIPDGCKPRMGLRYYASEHPIVDVFGRALLQISTLDINSVRDWQDAKESRCSLRVRDDFEELQKVLRASSRQD